MDNLDVYYNQILKYRLPTYPNATYEQLYSYLSELFNKKINISIYINDQEFTKGEIGNYSKGIIYINDDISPNKEIKHECLRGYEIKELIGKGGFGVVNQVCKKCLNKIENDCNYVMKIQNLKDEDYREVYYEEIRYIKILAKYGIGPVYYTHWECDDQGFIITEKWDRALRKGEIVPKNLLGKLESQIKTLRELNLIHGDILEKNILVKETDGKLSDITITDFGSVRNPIFWGKKPIDVFYDYLTKVGHNTRFYLQNLDRNTLYEEPYLLDQALLYHLKTLLGSVFSNLL